MTRRKEASLRQVLSSTCSWTWRGEAECSQQGEWAKEGPDTDVVNFSRQKNGTCFSVVSVISVILVISALVHVKMLVPSCTASNARLFLAKKMTLVILVISGDFRLFRHFW